MKTKATETKSKSTAGVAHLLTWIVCLGALILICSSASADNLFVSSADDSESGLGHIYEFTPNGVRSTFASGLNYAYGLAFDTAGKLFVSADAIYKFTPDGVRTRFASGPAGTLACDSTGNLFVATGDSDLNEFPINGSGKIYKFTSGGVRTTFASGLDLPTGLAFDSAGNLFVANIHTVVQDRTFSGAIYKFTAAGARTTFASGLSDPQALAFDNVGNLFVAEAGGGVIYKFTPSGVRSAFASGFSFPGSLACDSAGNLFVADSPAYAIYKIAPDGTQSKFATTDGVNLLAFQPRPASPLPAGPRSFANLSTRLRTELGNDVAIGGFIINGHAPKTVIVRACGPSVPVVGNLADPTLELHDGTGQMIAANDNWTSSRDNIMWSGLAPKDEHEAAIVTTLSPGGYTAVVRGVSNTSGVALVEIYDLSGVTDSKLANISTRGKVETGDDMMIGGFVIGGDQPTKVIIRAIGPSLTGAGVQDALQDPVLQLFNSAGTVVFENDDWRSAQQDQINASGMAPGDDRESAIVATLAPGSYTAIVRGKNDSTGVALVEIYNLETN
jgi:sugar lactone lactonase YvrE